MGEVENDILLHYVLMFASCVFLSYCCYDFKMFKVRKCVNNIVIPAVTLCLHRNMTKVRLKSNADAERLLYRSSTIFLKNTNVKG